MKKIITIRNKHAASEIVGGMFLVLIAVLAFIPIYTYILPLPTAPAEANVEFMGYVNQQGYAVIEHMGGEPLGSYEIYVDGQLVYESQDDPWEIGERNIPTLSESLYDENDQITVAIYTTLADGTKQKVFDGTITGKVIETPADPTEDPMLISSLRTNTVDEDLICYNYTITPSINAITYIYNWSVNGNTITDLYIPFDTDTTAESQVKDYSGNENDGTIYGPVWSNGKIGGSYNFDGIDDYISLPYCFSGNTINRFTVETWISPQATSGTIASFERDNYWELGILDGKIRFSTTSGSTTVDTIGTTIMDDFLWHHVAATYNSITGESKVFVDGELENSESPHSPGDELGSGAPITGTMGSGTASSEETILSTSFETQEEKNKWTVNNSRTNDPAGNAVFDLFGSDTMTPRTGSYSIGSSGDLVYWGSRRHAAYDRETIDISNYENVQVKLWYSYKSTEGTDEFGIYYKDGGSWAPIIEDYDPGIGQGNQLTWTYAEVAIPNSIDDLTLQFWWSTSESREYIAIDDLTITGTPIGGTNFSGDIDEFKIYNRALSGEQIHQNYLCTKDGITDKNIIVSDETNVGDVWKCTVTPNDATQDDVTVVSNTLQIVNYGGG